MNEKEELKSLLDKYSHAYYQGTPLISDYEYDALVDRYAAMGEEYKSLDGGACDEHGKVKLPYFMGSLDKIKMDDKAKFCRWYTPGEKVYLLDKIDGVSALYHKGKLYSRGNGYFGRDISHFLLDLNLPEVPERFSVRGELAISEEAFERSNYMDPRSMVAGHANSCTRHPDIKFYGFAVYTDKGLSFRNQLAFLKKYNFMTPWMRSAEQIQFENLHSILLSRKAAQGKDSYLIDGLVVAQDIQRGYPDDGNPKHVIAYKENDEVAVTEVTEVIWQTSKYGKLIPVVNFVPFFRNGVMIQRATGHNAYYIYTNNIGPGAKIAVVRSGEVIPYIAQVIEPAQGPSMPDKEYEWVGMHIQLVRGKDFELEKFKGFVKALEIRDLGDKRIEKMYNKGMRITKFLEVPKVVLEDVLGPSIGQKVYQNIQIAVRQLDKPKILVLSGAFGHGFGINRAQMLLRANPDLSQQLQQIHGFGEVVEKQVQEGIPKFWRWMQTQPTLQKIWFEIPAPAPNPNPDLSIDPNHPLYGQVILFSGFTSKDIKAKLELIGAAVKDTFTKDVTLLIVKDINSNSAKIKKAREAGIRIMPLSQFKH